MTLKHNTTVGPDPCNTATNHSIHYRVLPSSSPLSTLSLSLSRSCFPPRSAWTVSESNVVLHRPRCSAAQHPSSVCVRPPFITHRTAAWPSICVCLASSSSVKSSCCGPAQLIPYRCAHLPCAGVLVPAYSLSHTLTSLPSRPVVKSSR